MEAFQKIVLSQTNCFLLKAADGPLLVDCGSAGDEQRLMSKLGRMGLTCCPSAIYCLRIITATTAAYCPFCCVQILG